MNHFGMYPSSPALPGRPSVGRGSDGLGFCITVDPLIRTAGRTMSMSVSIVDLYSKAPNALCTLVYQEKKSFKIGMKTVKRMCRIPKIVW